MKLNKSKTGIVKKFDFETISLNLKRRAYKCIGIGTGRIVFDLNNGYVVKVAINKKGIAQNKAEYKIASNDETNLFAKIPSVSEGYMLLIMEKADKVKNISSVWRYFNVRNNRELYKLEKLQEVSLKYGLLLRDLRRHSNWGRINGKPVIIDYGFTKDVFEKHYKPLILKILGY